MAQVLGYIPKHIVDTHIHHKKLLLVIANVWKTIHSQTLYYMASSRNVVIFWTELHFRIDIPWQKKSDAKAKQNHIDDTHDFGVD